jgi:hypothetical protein
MSDEMVTLATFSNPIEAELAKGRLQDAGIPAFLYGDIGGSMFAGMSNLFGEIRLMVSATHAEEALRVLTDEEDEEEDEDESSTAIKGEPPRQESSTQVRPPLESPLQDNAPPLETSPQESSEFPPEEGMPPEEDDEREERTVAWTADEVATRALRAAIFGWFSGGVLAVYALWLLIRLPSAEGELSPTGRRKALLALVIAVLPGTAFLFTVLGLVIVLLLRPLAR